MVRVLLVSDGRNDLAGEFASAAVGTVIRLQSVDSIDGALAVLESGARDAIVVDHVVGSRSAETILSCLGARRPPVAVILSPWATVASFRRSELAGFCLHVVKPCAAGTVLDAIRLAVSLRGDGKLPSGTFDVIRFGSIFHAARSRRV